VTRAIEFDHDAVLRAAMGEFRRHGYGGTSIKTLEKATGLSVGSLYHSFGGKDAIFDRAMGHYNEVVVRRRIQTHLVGKPAEEGLRSLFMSLLPDRCDNPRGCLLINSAVEFGAEKSIRSAEVTVGLNLFENAFQATIDDWLKTQGAGPASKLARRHATTSLKLLAFYQGILVLIRLGRTKFELSALIDSEIHQLLENRT
jgi:TetR/AcrR family transcriptional regulator, transcriptional repressor for nem operon